MHRTFHVFSKLTLLFAVLAFPFTGCGYRRPAQVKTTGTVTLDGEPVANAALMFIPDSGRPAFGNIRPSEPLAALRPGEARRVPRCVVLAELDDLVGEAVAIGV